MLKTVFTLFRGAARRNGMALEDRIALLMLKQPMRYCAAVERSGSCANSPANGELQDAHGPT